MHRGIELSNELLLPQLHTQVGAVESSLVTLHMSSSHCAVLELNDACHHNATDLPLMYALRAQLSGIAAVAVSGVQAVVLQGAGAHFCTGGAQHHDAAIRLISSANAPMTAAVADLVDCVTLMQRLPWPVLSVLHGKMIGGGVALSLNTD
jgi:enoyl-CoA hydratase/carnithine racemase